MKKEIKVGEIVEIDTEKYCGTCALYLNESMTGTGWCDFHQEPFDCDEVCDYHTTKTNDNE